MHNPRGLNRQLLVQLLTGAYVHRHENVLIIGPTGCSKTYVTCALRITVKEVGE
ncbi:MULTISPECIES: ATP-binding protein [unclassified Serratia (in: enterobacteria)]|uniref:ATP-binding protein n=1 Tax=unclassified Serratia (in: enterobacteria) TaxID=2647522 RepID=UPI003B42A870